MNTPTHVFGYGARDFAEAKGWFDAKIIESDTAINMSSGEGGNAGEFRHTFITPGRYEGVSYYLGGRKLMRVSADHASNTTLVKGSLSLAKGETLEVENLTLENTNVSMVYANDVNRTLRVSNCTFKNWNKEQNGISNGHNATDPGKASLVEILDCTFIEVGGLGNTTHAIYAEGRPDSTLVVRRTKFLGGRGCSGVKSTMGNNIITDCEFDGIGPTGLTLHTPVDVVACSQNIIARNSFRLWFPDDYAKRPKGMKGTFTAAIFLRNRQRLNGSDIPAYPEASWEPPTASSGAHQRGNPGGGWDGTVETFTNAAFWDQVASFTPEDPENPFTFKSWISDNTLEYVTHPDGTPSRMVGFLRNDGTLPTEEQRQFGPTRVLRNMPNWTERSVAFLYENRLPIELDEPYELTSFASIGTKLDENGKKVPDIHPQAIWPRTSLRHFPELVFVYPVYVQPMRPLWFKA